MPNLNLPCLTASQCIEQAKEFKKQGERLEKGGWDAAARTMYILSTLMVSEVPVPRERLFHSNYFIGTSVVCLKIILSSWFATQRVAEKLSPQSVEAASLEKRVVYLLELIFEVGFNTFAKEELLVAYGQELLQHHEYDQFQLACEGAIHWNTEEYLDEFREIRRERRATGETAEDRRLLRQNCENHIKQCRQQKWQWLLQCADETLRKQKTNMKLGGS